MSDERPRYYAAYEEHSKTLRTWLVAYGVGASVLLLSNEVLWERLADAHTEGRIVLLFVSGAALQVVLSTMNKILMWVLYFGEEKPEFRKLRRYRFVNWLSEQFWIDAIVDLATIGVFVTGTYQLARTVLSP